ncbi:MAG: isocitrate/isopropylmalate family dehydrogenase, partial [Acidobacteriota bacterium]
RGGALLCGPGGGRFVYDLRARFDLFCKISPVRPLASLLDAGAVKPEAKKGADIFLVRENAGGDYFGRWQQEENRGKKIASHHVEYREEEVERIVRVALGLAKNRRGRLTLVLKSHGLPAISELWASVTEKLVKDSGVRLEILEADNAAFQLIQAARDFDVAVSSNLFGDILADCAGLLLGSRGLCFSGNFGTDGKAVYQTGHGAAYDLQGRDQANPVGQILSLALLLEVSFGLTGMATVILNGLEKTLGEGWRTADIASPGHRVVGTREFGQRLIDSLENPLTEQSRNAR